MELERSLNDYRYHSMNYTLNELMISLNELKISLNELMISLNELKISLNELIISLNELMISLNELKISLKRIKCYTACHIHPTIYSLHYRLNILHSIFKTFILMLIVTFYNKIIRFYHP